MPNMEIKKNESILNILLFALFIYLFISFLAGGFWTADSWRFLGMSREITETGTYSNFTNIEFKYPTPSYSIFMSSLSLISGLNLSVGFFRAISVFLGLFPIIFIYLIVRNYNKKLALIASFFAILGFGEFYINYAISSVPHGFSYLLLASLFYLNYLFLSEKDLWKTKIISIAHLLVVFALIFVHLWSAFLYIAFYFLFCCVLSIFDKEKIWFALPQFFLAFLFIISFLYTNPFLKHFFVEIPFIILPGLFLTSFVILFFVYRFRFAVKKALIKQSKKIDVDFNKYLWTGIFSIIAFGLFSIFVLTLFNPFALKRDFLAIFFSHISFFIFAVLLWAGLLNILLRKNYSLLKLIIPWIVTCSLMLLASFVALKLMGQFFDPWRHWAYLALLGVIPVSYAFLPFLEKKKTKKIIFLVFCLFLLTFSTSINFQFKYTDKEEFSSMEWVALNTENKAVIAGDRRLTGLVAVLADRQSLWSGFLPSIFMQNTHPPLLSTLNYLDYILWSDQYFKQGAGINETATNIKLNKGDYYKFYSPLFDKIYSTQNVELFKRR